MTAKLVTATFVSTSEKRDAFDRQARRELVAYRRERGLTCERLAEELGYSHAAVERWLGGKARVPGGVIIAIRGGKVAA